ncbi:MAG: hypothetical protein QM638_08960 [Nocardioides sp.]
MLLVLLVGGGAFALGMLATGGDDEPSVDRSAVLETSGSPGPTSASSPSSQPPGAGSSDGSDDGDNAADGAARRAAERLSRLMASSAADKSDVVAAVGNLNSCVHVRAATTTLEDAADSRDALVTKVKRLDITALPAARTVVTRLATAWTASAKADRSFADYGHSLHRTAKGYKGHEAWRRAGVDHSTASHGPKRAAAKAWRPIARRFGLPVIAWDTL